MLLSSAVCKIPAVSCCIMALEGEITFLVTHFKVGILNQDIFEGQLTGKTMICIVEDGDSFLVDDVKYSSKNYRGSRTCTGA